MTTIVRFAMTIVCSITLVLPVGWCAWFSDTIASAAPVAAVTCCKAEKHSQPDPIQDNGHRCCCDRDVTTPNKSVSSADDGFVAIPYEVLTVAVCPGPLDFAADISVGAYQPRTHILHCVWRC